MIRIGSTIWPGPVGIAAGLIKGAAAFIRAGEHADSVEVGSVTLKPLHGNEGPMISRYPKEQGIRHNAGMPNPGAEETLAQLKDAQHQIKIPWGLNLATTPGIKDTQQAAQDITQTTKILLEGGLTPNWLTLNVSSPDTQDDIKLLSGSNRVWALIRALKPILDNLRKPPTLWLKISPSLPKNYYSQLGQIALEEELDAIICSNAMPDNEPETGGWCGRPLRAPATATAWEMRQVTGGKIPIIGTGGVLTGKDVAARLQSGCAAVQVASALLLRGPTAPADIRREWELLQTQHAQVNLDRKTA